MNTMYRTLLILLYSGGLRIGEALSLTLQDVDLAERVITVRNTKFFKTRLVPIGPKLTRELAAHIQRRRQLPLPAGEDSPLFTTRTGKRWSYQHVIRLFQHVRRAAGIGCPAGEVVRHACMTCATLPPCTGWWRGIALGGMSSGSCRNWQPTSVTSISGPLSATCR